MEIKATARRGVRRNLFTRGKPPKKTQATVNKKSSKLHSRFFKDSYKRSLLTNLNTLYAESAITRTQKINVKLNKPLKDIYLVNTKEANKKYTFFCLNNDAASTQTYLIYEFENYSVTAKEFRAGAANIMKESRLLVKKVPLNDQGAFYNNDAAPATQTSVSSYSSSVTAGDFMLSTANAALDQRATTGTHKGYAFLIYINRTEKYRSRDFAANDCKIKVKDTSTSTTIERKQIVTAKLSGTYKLAYGTHITDAIDATKDPRDHLNKIPILANKFQIYWHSKGEEEILFYVRIVEKIQDLVPDGFTMNTNTIIGGEDGSTTVTISDYPDTTFTDIFKSSKKPNKFIFPISADYLAV
ncbi:MAG: hypothetical protein GY861_01740, partial [bacterium]|nr:hypothetical protein [bacterium]